MYNYIYIYHTNQNNVLIHHQLHKKIAGMTKLYHCTNVTACGFEMKLLFDILQTCESPMAQNHSICWDE